MKRKAFARSFKKSGGEFIQIQIVDGMLEVHNELVVSKSSMSKQQRRH